ILMSYWVKSAARLASLLLVVGVSSAFGALYTFNLTSNTRIASTVGGGLVVASVEDAAITIQLTALAGPSNSGSVAVITSTGAGVDDGNGGGAVGEDDIEGGAGAEALVLTPLLSSPAPFSIVSVTFTNTETGDDARIYLDHTANDNCTIANNCTAIDIDSSNPYQWVPTVNSQQFSTNITFRNDDGNDDYRVSQIVLDITPAAVPEPSTWTLFGLGAAALAFFRRKRS
ncbi:MAG: PEP-CTERM sorting domain-containing protein, partial [Bryobacterales bacterium]|nr:PEP-CTERM sorting domain-containing protein [Bryobacterales bacterium]